MTRSEIITSETANIERENNFFITKAIKQRNNNNKKQHTQNRNKTKKNGGPSPKTISELASSQCCVQSIKAVRMMDLEEEDGDDEGKAL